MGPFPRAAFAALLFAIPASPAFADAVPANSTIPSRINLVAAGPTGAGSGLGSDATVVYRDFAANPVPGAPVVLDFSACHDVALAVDQMNPDLTVDCAAHTVTAITTAAGVASFTVIGRGLPGVAPEPDGSLGIYADGTLLGWISVGAFDPDGVNGVKLSDLALWTADYFSQANPSRSNYNGIGGVDLLDLADWGRAYFNGTNSESAAT